MIVSTIIYISCTLTSCACYGWYIGRTMHAWLFRYIYIYIMNHTPLAANSYISHRPRCKKWKSPNVQDVFLPIPGIIISCGMHI